MENEKENIQEPLIRNREESKSNSDQTEEKEISQEQEIKDNKVFKIKKRINFINSLFLLTIGSLIALICLYCMAREDLEGLKESITYANKKGNYRIKNKALKHDQITLSDMQIKSSHNTYEHGSYASQLKYDLNSPYSGGCLAIEIDLIQNPDILDQNKEWEFWVEHSDQSNKSNVPQFSDILAELNFWSDQNPDHLPVYVVLDFKKDSIRSKNYSLYPYKINEIITKYVEKEKIYSNKEFIQQQQGQKNFIQEDEQKTLHDTLQQNGWPKLGDIKGKFIFIVSGDDRQKQMPVRLVRNEFSNLKLNEIGFVDIDSRNVSDLEQYIKDNPNRIIFNIAIKYGAKKYMDNLNVAQNHNFLTRVYKVNSKQRWNYVTNCLGINLIATDNIFETYWTVFKN